MVAAFLRVDPNSAPGDMLRVNSRVNVYGLVSVPGKGTRPYAILKNVRVISVGGSSADPDEGIGPGNRRRTGRSYRSVGIEVTEKTALDIMGVLAMIRGGKIWVMPRSRPAPGEEDEPSAELTPEVARLVRKFLDDGIDE